MDLPALVASFTFFSARLRCWETLDSTLEFRPGSRANLSVLAMEYDSPKVALVHVSALFCVAVCFCDYRDSIARGIVCVFCVLLWHIIGIR